MPEEVKPSLKRARCDRTPYYATYAPRQARRKDDPVTLPHALHIACCTHILHTYRYCILHIASHAAMFTAVVVLQARDSHVGAETDRIFKFRGMGEIISAAAVCCGMI